MPLDPPPWGPHVCSSVHSGAVFRGPGAPAFESHGFELGDVCLIVDGGSLTTVGRELGCQSFGSGGRVCAFSWLPRAPPALLRPCDSSVATCPWADGHSVVVADRGVLKEARMNVDSLGHDPFSLSSWFRDLNFNGSFWAGRRDRLGGSCGRCGRGSRPGGCEGSFDCRVPSVHV